MAARPASIAFGAGLILCFGPQGVMAQTLIETLSLAYQNNSRLAAARAELRATDEAVNQALAPSRPTIEVTGSQALSNSQYRNILTLSPPDYVSAPVQLDAKITQNLWRGGRTDVEERGALQQIYAARAGLSAVEQAVFYSTVSDYMNVYTAQKIFDLRSEFKENLRQEVDAIRSQLRISAVTKTDMAQAEAAYSEAIAALAKQRGALRAAEATYEHDVGEVPGKLVAPTGLPSLPKTREEAVELALSDAPEVRQADFTVRAAGDKVEAKRRELLPTLSLVGEANMNTQSQTIHSRQSSESIMLQLSVPLFDGGMVASQSRAELSVKMQQTKQLADKKEAATEAAKQGWDGVEASLEQIAALRDEVSLEESAVESVRNELSLGTRRIFDLTSQQQSLLEARVRLAEAERDNVLSQAALARSIGVLTTQGMNLPVQDYDPAKNLAAVHHAWIGLGSEQE